MNTLSFTTAALTQSLAYALLYSLVQGALIFGILFLLLKSFPGISSRIRYYLSYSAFATIALWFADTWVNHFQRLRGVTVFVQNAASVSSPATPPVAYTAAIPARFDLFAGYMSQVEKFVPAIIVLYSLGLLFMIVKYLRNVVQLVACTRFGLQRPAPEWIQFVNTWQQRLGITRQVQLWLSYKVSVPMMMGTLRPVILLPVATLANLTTDQVEAILLHELAHIRRHDYLLNFLQTIVETILFFNPFVWLISRVIRREREHCCDDLVVASASSPLSYARALALLEDHRISTNTLSMAATGGKNQLFNRIKRIMEMKNDNITQSRLSVLVATIMITTFITAMVSFTPSFAQKPKEEKKQSQTKTTTKTVTVDDNGKKKVVTKSYSSADPGDVKGVDIRISVNDADEEHATARVKVIANCDDGKDSNGDRKIRKRVIINSADHPINIERELDDVKNELNDIDWDEISDEINQAIAEVGKDLHLENLSKEVRVKIEREVEESRKGLSQAKKDVERARRDAASADRARDRADARKEEIEKEEVYAAAKSSKASAHAGKARASASSANGEEIMTDSDDMEKMLESMQKDGLIDRSEKFKVEKRSNTLYINGDKQPATVYDKYRKYLNGKEVIVKGSKGNLNVNVTN